MEPAMWMHVRNSQRLWKPMEWDALDVTRDAMKGCHDGGAMTSRRHETRFKGSMFYPHTLLIHGTEDE